MKTLELANLQKELDKKIYKKRKNGYTPRKKTLLDIKLSIDDELQEWARELPQEYNFKTWKQKEYNRDRELEELTDVLFFLLQFAIELKFLKWDYEQIEKEYQKEKNIIDSCDIDFYIWIFKNTLWETMHDNEEQAFILFQFYFDIVRKRGFKTCEVFEEYKRKWKINIERIEGDWVENDI